ncbi:hypothetical protein IVA86_26760 [Bradyrhizobium sp. 146]|uniref:hypothetical protein n=1 Tax=Bradyrhizobium sp. 146 TaxID=2782622 RepID=UPI001FFBB53C|nr:hypothetical protein [Bradyrhizobium sp. 146]MCK1704913.1 hypothetical protein [Bradyrhizobium sp. 146]
MKRSKSTIALNPHLMRAECRANLALLERAARNSIAFGADLRFDDDVWRIQEDAADRRMCQLWFKVDPEGDAPKNVGQRERLREPFATFLKSIIRLAEVAKHKKGKSYTPLLRAGRYLYAQLERRGHDPALLTARDFRQAEAAAPPKSRFTIAQNLFTISEVVRKYRLSEAIFKYKPTTKAPNYDRRRLDVKIDPAKLPSKAALAALPEIARTVTDASDTCMMRAIELLHCAPWRIGELFSLPEHCEIVTSVDGRPLTVADLESGTMPVRYGLRYRPEKSPGLSSDIKWIPSNAVPLVRRALKDLREHTVEARKIAAYMEEHPGRAWLPERFRAQERLSLQDVADVLQCTGKEARHWLRTYRIPVDPAHVVRDEFEAGLSTTRSARAIEKALVASARQLLSGDRTSRRFEIGLLRPVIPVRDLPRWLRMKQIPVRPATIARSDLEALLLSMNKNVSPGFPWKLSECLFVFPKWFFFRKRRSLLPVVCLMDSDQLRFFLTGHESQSVFERHDFKEDDGKPIHVTSHMFRRWLATLALDGEISAAEVRNWLGQSSDRWLPAYDYRTPDQLGREAREAIGEGFGIGPIAEIARSFKGPRDRDTFLEAVLATAHVTEYGMCARDWLSSPCVRHGACAACEKQLIRKGDAQHRESIARNLRKNRILLARADAEAEEGQRGAGNHARHLAREIAALDATIAVHDDPSIPDGSYVQLDLPALIAEAEAAT